MSSQLQALMAETAYGLQQALKRRDDASASDDSIERPTNRGNKLKRKAKYVQEGRLDTFDGPKRYKRKIEHAGYQRYIINRKPIRYDEDGDELDEDAEDEYADAMAAEEDPYSEIKLEEILMPLTSAATLHEHPSMSVPYYSSALTDLVASMQENLHREKAALYRMRNILTGFRGDILHMPLGELHTAYDHFILNGEQPLSTTGHSAPSSVVQGLDTGDHDMSFEVSRAEESLKVPPANRTASNAQQDVALDDQTSVHDFHTGHQASTANGTNAQQNGDAQTERVATPANGIQTNGASIAADETTRQSDGAPTADEEAARQANGDLSNEQTAPEPPPDEDNPDEDSGSQPTTHRMTTRARANNNNSTRSSPAPSTSSLPPLPNTTHPIFLIPPTHLPSPNVGLPDTEADITRKLLIAYVSRQEEVARKAEALYQSLLKAERMRREVKSWCRAEGHVGEMSDGEDWVDAEEWGLAEGVELAKGTVEEEDEGVFVRGRRGRGRAAEK